MTTLSSLLGGGVLAIHTGFIDGVSPTATGGANEDLRYWDVTISVTDYTKCMPYFKGYDTVETDAAEGYADLTCRLTSNTNLRVSNTSNNTGGATLVGRYHIVEYN